MLSTTRVTRFTFPSPFSLQLILVAQAVSVDYNKGEDADIDKRILDDLNYSLSHYYIWAILGILGVFLAYRITQRATVHMRFLVSIDGARGSRHYFSSGSPSISFLKARLLYAPIFRNRRAREIALGRWIVLGCLPTRIEVAIILIFIAANGFYLTWKLPWIHSNAEVLKASANRAGTLCVANLLPIMVLSSMRDPLISLLNISYATFNMMHRWLGRLAVLEALAHATCWLIVKVESEGWAAMLSATHKPFIYSGLTAALGFTVTLLQSSKAARHLAYELFLHLHIALAVLVLACLYRHLEDLPRKALVIGAAVTWGGFRGLRLLTLLYRSLGSKITTADVEILPHYVLRISIKCPRPWSFRPGQYLYLTLPSVGLWTAHPFSVAWSGEAGALDSTLSTGSQCVGGQYFDQKTLYRSETSKEKVMFLIIRTRSGLTKKLWRRAIKADGPLHTIALIEGPYGITRDLSSYGIMILFAGGVGITYHLEYIRTLILSYALEIVATKRITLVWVIPSTGCLYWIRSWLREILVMKGRSEVLQPFVYVTRARWTECVQSSGGTIRVSKGRPDIESLMRQEAAEKLGCMGV
ncbi:uncharacterized protein PV06_10995 [Exophiala oligosperma]|uniref:ferric-chelate reductase (NADPH) n=1 Tax=Exophiala oligosperma TaxID=215243 RepID=A0A0D2A968_9EURO|nr:uncharacterized protein PV06_10995 [Exophiala oligosperma]KIW36881.1 hypothetical protein PV06_10995 [Exophiala oligosperma]